jgi:hypothetical protein
MCLSPYVLRLSSLCAEHAGGVRGCSIARWKRLPVRLWPWRGAAIGHKTAIFRQVNKDRIAAHHDALEFPDGEIVLLTLLAEGQQATVLQLPAEPKTAAEAESQTRTAYVG